MFSAIGRHQEARNVLEDMLQRFPNHWSVCATAGRVLIEVFHDQERACAVSARVPACQPELAQAWFQHGRVLMLAGQHRDAIAAFEHGWEQLPDAAEADFAAPAALWLSASYGAVGQETKKLSWWKTAMHCTRHGMTRNPAMSRDWPALACT
jgi:tetratricopeptide (TPR) repeat protein